MTVPLPPLEHLRFSSLPSLSMALKPKSPGILTATRPTWTTYKDENQPPPIPQTYQDLISNLTPIAQSPSRPLNTAIKLDYSSYPDIIHSILTYLPDSDLVSLRLASKHLKTQADKLLFSHIVVSAPFNNTQHTTLRTPHGTKLPGGADTAPHHLLGRTVAEREAWLHNLAHTKVVDYWRSAPPVPSLAQLQQSDTQGFLICQQGDLSTFPLDTLPNLHTIRRARCAHPATRPQHSVDFIHLAAETADTDERAHPRPLLPARRVVITLIPDAHTRASARAAEAVGALPAGVEELVVLVAPPRCAAEVVAEEGMVGLVLVAGVFLLRPLVGSAVPLPRVVLVAGNSATEEEKAAAAEEELEEDCTTLEEGLKDLAMALFAKVTNDGEGMSDEEEKERRQAIEAAMDGMEILGWEDYVARVGESVFELEAVPPAAPGVEMRDWPVPTCDDGDDDDDDDDEEEEEEGDGDEEEAAWFEQDATGEWQPMAAEDDGEWESEDE